MAYKEVVSEVFRFEQIGDFVEGKLLEKVPGSFDQDNYKIETKEGKEVLVFGTTVLSSRMSFVKVGSQIKIEFTESIAPSVKGHNPTKIFKVYVDE